MSYHSLWALKKMVLHISGAEASWTLLRPPWRSYRQRLSSGKKTAGVSLEDLSMNCGVFHIKLLMSAVCSELLETRLLRASALLFSSQISEPRACLSSEPGTVAVGVSLMIYEQRDGNGAPFLQFLVETYIHHKCPSCLWFSCGQCPEQAGDRGHQAEFLSILPSNTWPPKIKAFLLHIQGVYQCLK